MAAQTRPIKASPFWAGRQPTISQWAFLATEHKEVLFGGAAGGGKSESLLMAASQYSEIPGYAALLLRRTYADLALPGALMDRAYEWWGPTAAHWSEKEKTWTFPSSATVSFGYLETDKHKYRYQGSEFQFIGYDELTQFPEPSYLYLFSRLRRTRDIPVPLRMRAGSNPGGEGHQWVYERFIVPHANRGRLFIPAGLRDNPYIDVEGYVDALAELDDITRAQLLDGLWVTDPSRRAFLADWWRRKNRFVTDDHRANQSVVARFLSWDTGLKDKETSAYSACVVLELLKDYRLRVREVWRDKLQFPDLPDAIERMAHRWNQDGKLRQVLIEDKASGTSAYQTLMRSAPEWLSSILINFEPTGDKEQRAKQAAVWAKRDMILLPFPNEDTGWLSDFESELYAFPDCVYKDQVDAFGQAVLWTENLVSVGWQGRQQREAMMNDGN